jgi:hypothetical protein
MSDDEGDEAIFRVDTVPPPAGESDAYSAPTRVGPMAAAVVEEMMVASVRKAVELTQAAEEKAAASERKAAAAAKAVVEEKSLAAAAIAAAKKDVPPPDGASGEPLTDGDIIAAAESAPGAAPRGATPGKPPPVPLKAAPVPLPPRVYDEADDEDNAATLLSRSAKAPLVDPIGTAPAPTPEPVSTAPSGLVASPLVPTQASPGAFLSMLPILIGLAILAIGLALHFWVR